MILNPGRDRAAGKDSQSHPLQEPRLFKNMFNWGFQPTDFRPRFEVIRRTFWHCTPAFGSQPQKYWPNATGLVVKKIYWKAYLTKKRRLDFKHKILLLTWNINRITLPVVNPFKNCSPNSSILFKVEYSTSWVLHINEGALCITCHGCSNASLFHRPDPLTRGVPWLAASDFLGTLRTSI